nr:MAG TPA: hypothetical protein [Caudoviricetes sp.]
MVKYIFVKIAYRAQTVDNEYMPLWLYSRPLYVIKETQDTVIVRYNNSEFYTYEFDKKYIEKSL